MSPWVRRITPELMSYAFPWGRSQPVAAKKPSPPSPSPISLNLVLLPWNMKYGMMSKKQHWSIGKGNLDCKECDWVYEKTHRDVRRASADGAAVLYRGRLRWSASVGWMAGHSCFPDVLLLLQFYKSIIRNFYKINDIWHSIINKLLIIRNLILKLWFH